MDLFSQIGTQELLVILLVAIIVIGPNKIVEFGRSFGKFTRNIKKMTTDMTSTITKEIEYEENNKTDKSKPSKKEQ